MIRRRRVGGALTSELERIPGGNGKSDPRTCVAPCAGWNCRSFGRNRKRLRRDSTGTSNRPLRKRPRGFLAPTQNESSLQATLHTRALPRVRWSPHNSTSDEARVGLLPYLRGQSTRDRPETIVESQCRKRLVAITHPPHRVAAARDALPPTVPGSPNTSRC